MIDVWEKKKRRRKDKAPKFHRKADIVRERLRNGYHIVTMRDRPKQSETVTRCASGTRGKGWSQQGPV